MNTFTLKRLVQLRASDSFVRFFIMFVALFALPLTAGAWSDLKCGNNITNTWDENAPDMTANPSNSDNEFTYTLTASSANDIYFRIRGKIMSGDNYAYLVPDNDGDAVDPTKHYVATADRTDGNSKDKSFKITGVAKGDEYKITALYTNGGSGDNWYWTLNVEKTKSGSSSGGSSTTIVNKEGLYIYGSMFDTDNLTSNTKLHYKLLKRKGNIYYISVLADDYTFNPEQYSTGSQTDKTISPNGATFKLAYVDAEGNLTTYTPSSEFTLSKTATAPTAETLTASGTGDWKIENNGGMYNLVITTNDDGIPQSWTFESDPLRIVGYKAGSGSNWTTNSYMYCTRTSETSSYNSNFFGNINYNTGEEFKWILGNMWFGSKKSPYKGPNEENLAWDDDSNSPNMTPVTTVTNNGSGVYFTEFNPSRGDYKIGGNGKPKKVYIIGSAIDSYATDLFTGLDPANATELQWDDESQCYKGEMTFTHGKYFRFLINNDATLALTLADNVGEDSNAPFYTGSVGTDTWDNNKVQYQYYDGTTDSGNNIDFDAPTGVYAIRFYIESSAGQDDFNDLSKFAYHYTLNLVTLPYAVVNPSDLVVYYGSTVSPFVSVKYVDESKAGKYVVAYTSDGSDPTYTLSDETNELPTATGTTKVADLDDIAARYAETATYYLDENGNVLFDDANGKGQTYNGTVTTDADGNKVITPVKAQAFRQYTSGSKMLYKPSGVVAMGSYTLQVRGGLEPGTTSRVTSNGYKLSITAPTTTQINKWRAIVEVTGGTTTETTGSTARSENQAPKFSQPRRTNSEPTMNRLGPDQIDPNLVHADVPVFYTTDGSDPSVTTNNKRHLVTEVVDGKRVITIYQGDTGDNNNDAYHGKLRVWLAGGTKPTAGTETDYYKEANYDITYSTSEGGYSNFIYNDNKEYPYNSEGVDPGYYLVDSCAYIYIQPTDPSDSIYIYAQEEEELDGQQYLLALTAPCPGFNFTSKAEKTYLNSTNTGEEDPNPWYLITLPKQSAMYSGYTFKGINLQITSKKHPKPVTLRNVGFDLKATGGIKTFLKYDNATGIVTDESQKYNFFQTGFQQDIENDYNKPFYPSNGTHGFTVNVPSNWENVYAYEGDSKTGSRFISNGITPLTDGTTDYSFDLAITPTEGETFTIVPWHDNGKGNNPDISAEHSFKIKYTNGGYYAYVPSYEIATEGTASTTLIYGDIETGSEIYGEPAYDCINRNHAPKYDKTYLINPVSWFEEEEKTTEDGYTENPQVYENSEINAEQSWNKKKQRHFLLNGDTQTMVQPVLHLEPNTQYTVQAIVGQSGTDDANVDLILKKFDPTAFTEMPEEGDEEETGNETEESTENPYSLDNPEAQVTATFNSSSKQQLTPTGRIDSYDLGDNAGNGKWQKLETTITTDDKGAIIIGLKRGAGEIMVTDVTLLENANTDGNVWTKAETGKDKSFVDLSDRTKANSFSFFERGSNLNSVIFVDKNTVVGGNAFDGREATEANAGAPYNVAAGSDKTYNIADLKLTDTDGSTENDGYHNDHTFGFTINGTVTADKVSFDRKFARNRRQSICLPFSLNNSQLSDIGVTKVYTFTGISFNKDTQTGNVEWTAADVNSGNATIEAGKPYIIECGSTTSTITNVELSTNNTIAGEADSIVSATNSIDKFKGLFKFATFPYNTSDKPTIWFYENGKFMPGAYASDSWYSDSKPFRAYFTFDTNETVDNAKGMNFTIVDDGTTTNIDPVEFMNETSDESPIYNLNGQLVSRNGSQKDLPRGVYIQNNKKFVVR